jgi:hypothetical protein
MTSGSSSNVKSSGTILSATGGAILPAIVGGPMLAFPFSALVAGRTAGYVNTVPIYIRIGSYWEDYAVSSSTCPPFDYAAWPFRSITIGGRDG